MKGVECRDENVDLALQALGAALQQGLCPFGHLGSLTSLMAGLGYLKSTFLAYHEAVLQQEEPQPQEASRWDVSPNSAHFLGAYTPEY